MKNNKVAKDFCLDIKTSLDGIEGDLLYWSFF